jgi:hypothetical protein
MKQQRSVFRRLLSAFGWSFLALIVFGFVGIPTWTLLTEKWAIESALKNAKSVELIHYNPYSQMLGSEMIYGTKELDPKDFHKISDAFPLSIDVGFPVDGYTCIFAPHHRIVITDADGKQTVIRVCFICDHCQVGNDESTFITPYVWRSSLRQFFIEEGLPFQPDRYQQDYIQATSAKADIETIETKSTTNAPPPAPAAKSSP